MRRILHCFFATVAPGRSFLPSYQALHHKPSNYALMTDCRIRPVGLIYRFRSSLYTTTAHPVFRLWLVLRTELPVTNIGISAYLLAVTVLPRSSLAYGTWIVTNHPLCREPGCPVEPYPKARPLGLTPIQGRPRA